MLRGKTLGISFLVLIVLSALFYTEEAQARRRRSAFRRGGASSMFARGRCNSCGMNRNRFSSFNRNRNNQLAFNRNFNNRLLAANRFNRFDNRLELGDLRDFDGLRDGNNDFGNLRFASEVLSPLIVNDRFTNEPRFSDRFAVDSRGNKFILDRGAIRGGRVEDVSSARFVGRGTIISTDDDARRFDRVGFTVVGGRQSCGGNCGRR